ncbi:HD domain-containing protein [Virgibacillus proomii]|uniref:HD domain-containing protein n=1 Tax=Virgibacillus proomii TaxID=84407 RepID=UPI001C0F4F33|nr:HD domain-containing protein [Virgibacillus proomii]MBU5267362.1 HD domain-containing protein [Virgibacillus proomii]
MIINDPLYGTYQVDGVLAALINSRPVQRLKGIHQGGASYLVNPAWNVTRFDHSIGVMLLIKRLGGSLEEQIAGLLHDISHTAFSHIIDFVMDNEKEDYHERIFHEVVINSELPLILKTYGYNYEEIIMDDSKWTLLEQSAPELCADRVDYTLRDMYTYRNISLADVEAFLQNLIVIDGKMYLNKLEIAEWFVELYYKEVIGFFMGPLNIYGSDRLTVILQQALEKGIISLSDFFLEDEEVIEILRSTQEQEINQLIVQLQQPVSVIEDENNYHIHRKTKPRLIDPSILSKNQLIRSSKLSNRIKEMNQQAYEKAKKGSYLRILG